ncbi:MAG: bifunctional serine/threonine-protein kinase/formylglycine-generating enzyme family protein [Planctomycetota bacterium]
MNQPADKGQQQQPQRRLGPYTITRKLGEGGMGAVYLGRHSVLDVDHAIKVLPPRLAQNQQFIERFLREARHAARLNHPHIVQVVGADKFGDTRYIAMQFVPGESLERMVRTGGAMPPHKAVRYTYHVAQALAYAHASGMIHRDVKPDNVLVDESDNARLTDFGLVREMNANPEGAGLTQSGAVLGTPYYMSPEQWRNEGVDHRSDVYALGVMLYYMLSRRFPFPGEGPAQILRKQIEGRPDPLDRHVQGLDQFLLDIVHRTVDVNAETRTQTAADFGDLLVQWWQANPDNGGITLDTNVGGTVIRTKVGTSGVNARPSMVTPPGAGNTLLESGGTMASDGARISGAQHATGAGIGVPPPPPPPMQQSGVGGLQFNSQTGTPPQMVMTSAGPAMLTQTGAGQTYVTLTADPNQQKQIKLIIGLVVVALVAVAVVLAVVLSGGAGGGKGKPGPELQIGIADGTATETSPLFVNATTWAIPGTARGTVTVNGTEYEMGRAVDLGDEMNTLRVEVVGENGEKLSRTLYVYHDCEIPRLKLVSPDPATIRDNRLIAVDGFEVKGIVKDTDPKIEVHLRRGDAEQVLPLRGGGEAGLEFGFRIEVQKQPLEIQLQAKDRSGNVSGVINFTVEFAPLMITGINIDTTMIEVADPRQAITITGSLNSGRNVSLRLDSKPLDAKINPDTGDFSFQWVPGGTGTFRFTLVPVGTVRGEGKAEEVTLNIQRKIYEKVDKPEGEYREYRRLTDGMICVEVPAGDYKRGAPSAFDCGDAPEKTIALSAFLIDKFEVSNGQYAMYLNEGGPKMTRLEPAAVNGSLIDPAICKVSLDDTSGKWVAAEGLEKRPVVGVTWKGASEYAKWADPYGGSLPSEARWEAAARGKSGRLYPWGDDFPSFEFCHFKGSGFGKEPLDVNDNKVDAGKSVFGARNLAGNVEEWCQDFYKAGGYLEATGPDPVVSRPSGGETARVVRGGSFSVEDKDLEDLARIKPAVGRASYLPSFSRASAKPEAAAEYRGFRCAATTPDSRR